MLRKLQKLGLTEKESNLYLALVKLGEATANQLAKQTSSNRTVTYNILQQLVEKGFITYAKKEKKRFYSIANPNSLLAPITEKEILAKNLIKEINTLKKEEPSDKIVEIYEGISGLRFIFEELKIAKDLRVLNATGLIFKHLKFSAKHIVKDITSKKDLRVIANYSMRRTPLSEFKMKLKFLPKKSENFATTFIFENKVIILNLKDKPFIIKIENREISDGFKKDFDLLWGFI